MPTQHPLAKSPVTSSAGTATPGPGGRHSIYSSLPGILLWGVGACCDTLAMTLVKGSEGKSWGLCRVIALLGSQEPRQRPGLPPGNRGHDLGSLACLLQMWP